MMTLTCDLALTKYSVRLLLGFSTLHSTAMRGLMFCMQGGKEGT